MTQVERAAENDGLRDHIMICATHEAGQWTAAEIAEDLGIDKKRVIDIVHRMRRRNAIAPASIPWHDASAAPVTTAGVPMHEAEWAWECVGDLGTVRGAMVDRLHLLSGVSRDKCSLLVPAWRRAGILGKHGAIFSMEG